MLFFKYVISCVFVFCIEVDVELVVVGVDIEEGWIVNLVEMLEEDDWVCMFFLLFIEVDVKGVER